MADSTKKKKTQTGKPGRPKGSGAAKSGASSRSKRSAEREEYEEEGGFMRAEVMIIGSFAIAVLFFLSNFHLCGALGAVSYTHLDVYKRQSLRRLSWDPSADPSPWPSHAAWWESSSAS